MSDDEMRVEAKVDGVSISAKGSAVSRIGHSIADMISPISEAFGLAGDQFNALRLGRAETAYLTLQRAYELRSRKEFSGRPVSRKILIPWLEGASNEAPEDNISDIWARILARAPEEYDAKFSHFVAVCESIGKPEAELFSRLMEAAESSLNKTKILSNLPISSVISMINKSEVQRNVRHILKDATNSEAIDAAETEVWTFLEDNSYIDGCAIVNNIYITAPDGNQIALIESTDAPIARTLLVRIGLLARTTYSISLDGFVGMSEYLEPTDLGVSFYKAISETDLADLYRAKVRQEQDG